MTATQKNIAFNTFFKSLDPMTRINIKAISAASNKKEHKTAYNMLNIHQKMNIKVFAMSIQ